MKADDRRVAEGILYQGVDEQIVYTLDVSAWGLSPTSPAVKAYDMSDAHKDVTATVLSGTASVAGNVITLPKVKSLTQNHRYRIEVQFTIGTGATPFEAYIVIVAQR